MQSGNHHTVAGTAGGTLLAIFSSIHPEDVVKTAVLAVVGAVVSFTASLLLKRFAKGKRPKR